MSYTHMTEHQRKVLDLLTAIVYEHISKDRADPKLLETLANLHFAARRRISEDEDRQQAQTRLWHLQLDLRSLLDQYPDLQCSNHQLKKSKPTNPLTIISTTWTNFKRKLLK